jgi:hypothetical protein
MPHRPVRRRRTEDYVEVQLALETLRRREAAADRTGDLLLQNAGERAGGGASVRSAEGQPRLEAGLLAGVAAFLIAILPIRAVLVPAYLNGLTLVDYALGTEMAVMVAATIVVVAGRSGRRTLK